MPDLRTRAPKAELRHTTRMSFPERLYRNLRERAEQENTTFAYAVEQTLWEGLRARGVKTWR